MKLRTFGFALVAVLLFAGCKSNQAIEIKTLLDDPAQYDHKVVTVAGTVGRSLGVLGYGAYELSDDTGNIAIGSKSGGAPREGAEVVLRGAVRKAFTLGTTTPAAMDAQDAFSKR